MSRPSVTAAELCERWRLDLESWAIPPQILAATPESPWVLPRRLFERRAELRMGAPSGASFERALEALVTPGSVLDVGTGAGAACLPLVAWATAITAVDGDEQLLGVLAASAGRLGADVTRVCGRWPDVANGVEPADLVTCHHVLYNVPDIEPFVTELTAHARRRVVVEMTAVHPLTFLNPLWERFHGLVRPSVPTAEAMLELLEALGLAPSHQVWAPVADREYETFEDMVEVTRRRLCLDPSRAGEVAEALGEQGDDALGELRTSRMDLFTIWWSGNA
ncbi:MAG: methyltransferase domain-containing protein [Acidimicrobiales bacterium]